MSDVYIVITHFIVNAIVICPVVISIVFHQVGYAPYSLNHPANQFSDSDFKFSIVYFPFYIDLCDKYLLAFIILILVYMGLSAIEEFFIFLRGKFPPDRAFEDEAKQGVGI